MMVQKILVVLIGIKLSDTSNYDDNVKKKLNSLHELKSKNK
jgi:hypothetical protein